MGEGVHQQWDFCQTPTTYFPQDLLFPALLIFMELSPEDFPQTNEMKKVAEHWLQCQYFTSTQMIVSLFLFVFSWFLSNIPSFCFLFAF